MKHIIIYIFVFFIAKVSSAQVPSCEWMETYSRNEYAKILYYYEKHDYDSLIIVINNPYEDFYAYKYGRLFEYEVWFDCTDDKIAEIKTLQKTVEDLLASYNEKEESKLMSLVKIYENCTL